MGRQHDPGSFSGAPFASGRASPGNRGNADEGARLPPRRRDHHSGTRAPDAAGSIDFPIRYLRELDAAVCAAIGEGRSVEATLAAVGMPHYSGYSLFEWAHDTVNVPAAYKHLRDLPGEHADAGQV